MNQGSQLNTMGIASSRRYRKAPAQFAEAFATLVIAAHRGRAADPRQLAPGLSSITRRRRV